MQQSSWFIEKPRLSVSISNSTVNPISWDVLPTITMETKEYISPTRTLRHRPRGVQLSQNLTNSKFAAPWVISKHWIEGQLSFGEPVAMPITALEISTIFPLKLVINWMSIFYPFSNMAKFFQMLNIRPVLSNIFPGKFGGKNLKPVHPDIFFICQEW